MALRFEKAILDNQLTIIGEINDAAHTAAGGFFVKTGSRDETPELMGVSHFLEHMMFKGTDRRTAAQVNIEFDQIGASYNASTSQENTCFFAHVLPEYTSQAIDLLSDILRPALRTDDFEMEKQVILEEIGMYADQPFWVAYEQAMEQFFSDHTLAYRILGTQQTIGDLTADQMRDYFEHWYSPDNMVVVLAGNVDFDACVKQIDKACGHWPTTGARREYVQPKHATGQLDRREAKFNRQYLLVLCPGPARQDDQRHAAMVLANMLGDSDGSRLYWKLVDPGLADEADLIFHPFDQSGSFMAYASCSPDRADETESAMVQVLDNAAADISDAELARSRNKIATSVMLQNELPLGRMLGLGADWLYSGEYRPLEKQLADIESVDRQAVEQLIEQWSFQPRTVVRLGPE